MIHGVDLPRLGTVAAWRKAARELLAAGVPPQEVHFNAGPSLFPLSDPPPVARAPALRLSRQALGTLENALCHSDPQRFDRAYAVLWRLARGELRWANRSDPAMRKLLDQAKSVGRDIHKMHAFVRFRELPSDGPRRAFAAWFEPEHPIAEAASPFFARRFGDMDWCIRTPGVAAIFEAGQLRFEETAEDTPPPEDATEELWCTYYTSIFNPARLMVKAMQSEMPQKFWKNLPEARLIPDLIRTAPARARDMQLNAPTQPPPHAAAIARARQDPTNAVPQDPGGMPQVIAQARRCDRCTIGQNATQLVWGEGPSEADLMVVGEQPGDQEDLAGRSFVGPAGQLLDRAFGAVGLDRAQIYVTNAVKHFGFAPRGKRRIHQRPHAGEVEACKWWLDLEIAQIRPRLILALGATAAQALTGSGQQITRRRGTIDEGPGGCPVYLSVHPAYLLRLPDAAERARQLSAFEDDLRHVAGYLAQIAENSRAPVHDPAGG